MGAGPLQITRSSPPSSGVTSVSATSPITSTGGTTPVISTSMATNKLIGRGTAGTGVMEEITLGTNLSYSGTTLNAASSTFPLEYIAGLVPAWTSATLIGATSGKCRNSTDAADITLSSAFTKGTGAWTAGTGNGGMDTGSVASSTQYHWFVIKKDSDGTGDLLFSLSATAPTMPAGYTYFRYIFSMRTNGSTQWTKFWAAEQNRGSVLIRWDVPVRDINTTNPGTARVTPTLASVPSGVRVAPIGTMTITNATSNIYALVGNTEQVDTAPSSSLFNFAAKGGVAGGSTFNYQLAGQILTDTSGNIFYRQDASGASDTMQIIIDGWINFRN